MSDIRRRMNAIEQAELRRERRKVVRLAAELGLTYDELMEEAEAFLAQPLADQLAEVDRILAESVAAGVPWDEADHIKATLTEHWHP